MIRICQLSTYPRLFSRNATKSAFPMLDFGVSKALSTLCMAYMAPDQQEPHRLYITDKAREKMHQLSIREPDHALSILVQVGGCHGFQYHLAWERMPAIPSSDTAHNPSPIKPGLLCFHFVKDHSNPKQRCHLLIDTATLSLIRGSSLDYMNEIIGEKFVIINNPNADAGCGCGVSFGLKEQ